MEVAFPLGHLKKVVRGIYSVVPYLDPYQCIDGISYYLRRASFFDFKKCPNRGSLNRTIEVRFAN
jgi:hypothetical protein